MMPALVQRNPQLRTYVFVRVCMLEQRRASLPPANRRTLALQPIQIWMYKYEIFKIIINIEDGKQQTHQLSTSSSTRKGNKCGLTCTGWTASSSSNAVMCWCEQLWCSFDYTYLLLLLLLVSSSHQLKIHGALSNNFFYAD